MLLPFDWRCLIALATSALSRPGPARQECWVELAASLPLALFSTRTGVVAGTNLFQFMCMCVCMRDVFLKQMLSLPQRPVQCSS